MYTIIYHIPSSEFTIISKKERCFYNDGRWTNSINKLLQSPNITKEYFNKYDAICTFSDFSKYLKEFNLISIIDIPVLDYKYVETNYPELLI
jgi:hypothetical protein